MLAYVFWHEPRPHTDRAEYERRLRAFHRALAENPPPGFVTSKAYRAEGTGRHHVEVGYEDWYLVEGWSALGSLNDAAMSGLRRAPHDEAAALAASGTAGVYRLLRGTPQAGEKRFALWLGKPRGVRYDEFTRRLDSIGETLWQRQMVLGPGPEFCIAGHEHRPDPGRVPDEWDCLLVERTLVWPEIEF